MHCAIKIWLNGKDSLVPIVAIRTIGVENNEATHAAFVGLNSK